MSTVAMGRDGPMNEKEVKRAVKEKHALAAHHFRENLGSVYEVGIFSSTVQNHESIDGLVYKTNAIIQGFSRVTLQHFLKRFYRFSQKKLFHDLILL